MQVLWPRLFNAIFTVSCNKQGIPKGHHVKEKRGKKNKKIFSDFLPLNSFTGFFFPLLFPLPRTEEVIIPCKNPFALPFYISLSIGMGHQLGTRPKNARKMITLSLQHYAGSFRVLCRLLGSVLLLTTAAGCSKGSKPALQQPRAQCCSNNCDSCVSLVGCMQSDWCVLMATGNLIWVLR